MPFQRTATSGLIVCSSGASHDGSPQLVRHFRNAVLREDARGSRITKERRGSVNKIDLAVASLIGLSRACAWREEDLTEPQLLVL